MLQSKDIGWLFGLKNKTHIHAANKTHARVKDTHRLKVRGWKKIFHANGNKKAVVAILISDKIDFKTKSITKEKEGHYIMIKRAIKEEAITLVNIYTPSTRAHKYIKQISIDIKGEIGNKTIMVGNFNILFTSMDRLSRQKNQ